MSDLTDADREYCRRWCADRGRRPHHYSEYENLKYLRNKWTWYRQNYQINQAEVPASVWIGAQDLYDTEQAALDALALALRECRAAAAIPADVADLHRIIGHGPEGGK